MPAIVIAVGLSCSVSAMAIDWYSNSWDFRQQIIINTNQVSGIGSLTNFPIVITQANVDTGLWANAQASGNDILFTAGDAFTKLSHEIETYDAGSSQLCAWVRIPELSKTLGTNIYMYYGHPGASGQQDATNVWINNFVGIWHLAETNGNAFDSTAYDNDGTPNISDRDLGRALIDRCDSLGTWSGGNLSLGTYSTWLHETYACWVPVYTTVLQDISSPPGAGVTNKMICDPAADLDLGNRWLFFYFRSDRAASDFDSVKVWIYDTNENYRVHDITGFKTNTWKRYQFDIVADGSVGPGGAPDSHAVDRIEWTFGADGATPSFTNGVYWLQAYGGIDQDAEGLMGGADGFFDAAQTYYNCGQVPGLDYGTNNFTWSFWEKHAYKEEPPGSGVPHDCGPVGKGRRYWGSGSRGFYIEMRSTWDHYHFGISDTSNNWFYSSHGKGDSPSACTAYDGDWHLIQQTIDRPNSEVKLYYDGGYIRSVSLTSPRVGGTGGDETAPCYDITSTAEFRIGRTVAANWFGRLDEIRIANGIRSAEWIATGYNNQSSPGTFYSMEDELQRPRAGTIVLIR